MGCKLCEKNQAPEGVGKVLEIVNSEKPVLFHKVLRSAALGDDTAENGTPADQLDYKNVLLVYEANNHIYLYSSDGAATLLSKGDIDVELIEAQIRELGSQIEANSTSITELRTAINNSDQDIADLTDQLDKTVEELDGLSTTVSDIADEVSAAQGDINALQSSLANETQERTNADNLLRESITTNTSSIDTINTNLNVAVEQSTKFQGNDSTMDVVHTKVNLSNGEQTTTTDALPVASTTSAGIINASTFSSIQESAELVNAILQGAVALKGIAADVSQDTLTALWKGASGESELINRASIYDEDNNRIWTYYGNTGEWKALSATNGGEVTVSQATNDSLGIVKGSTLPGQIFVEPDGSQSVNEWDKTQERIMNLENSMTTENERTKNLPPQVVYRTSLPEYKEDEVDLTLVVKDLHTGGDASIPLNLMGATESTAGVMTSAQVKSLTEIADQFPTTMQDVDDALGDIAVIQADYVSKNNIKTINGTSIIGTGNISISGASGGVPAFMPTISDYSANLEDSSFGTNPELGQMVAIGIASGTSVLRYISLNGGEQYPVYTNGVTTGGSNANSIGVNLRNGLLVLCVFCGTQWRTVNVGRGIGTVDLNNGAVTIDKISSDAIMTPDEFDAAWKAA